MTSIGPPEASSTIQSGPVVFSTGSKITSHQINPGATRHKQIHTIKISKGGMGDVDIIVLYCIVFAARTEPYEL